MSRAEYTLEEDRNRLFKNTLADPKDGVRDHCILRLLYGLPLRPVELIRLETLDFVNSDGVVFSNADGVLRKEISFNGLERPFPILDKVLISSLQAWVDWRIENQWGVTRTGFIDLNTPFFMTKKNVGFKVHTSYKDDNRPKHNAESMNRIIRGRMNDNCISGSVESGLRTWTIDRHRESRSTAAIWALRGDKSLNTVKEVIAGDPIRLGALVEKVY